MTTANTRPQPQFVHCGCCELYHPIAFTGDCRDDANRFCAGDLDQRFQGTRWHAWSPRSHQPPTGRGGLR